MTPPISQVRDLNTDEVMRSNGRGVNHLPCDLLPERIDALTKVLAARDSALLAEFGHLRGDFKDLSLSVRELTAEIRPLAHDRVDSKALEKARAEVHQEQATVSKAWADFFNSPTTKAIFVALAGALGAAGLLRSCVLVEPPPEPAEAHADGAFWRGR